MNSVASGMFLCREFISALKHKKLKTLKTVESLKTYKNSKKLGFSSPDVKHRPTRL